MADFDFLTDKSDLRRAQWASSSGICLAPSGVVVELERFALTANNLTYAKLGEAFGYWRYFPAPQGFGRIPVWGVARVVESSSVAVTEGERVYGLLPISTRATLTPAVRGAFGFVDAAPHRAGLPQTYNEYRLIDRDPIFRPEDEDAYLALRPLFILGFFLAEWLAENPCFGAERVIVSSASSKAAAALAHQLAGVDKLGLTSERNLAAVAKVKLFDEAIAYSAVADRDDLGGRSSLFVDIAGDPAVAEALKRRLGPALLKTVAVGATRSDPALLGSPGEGGLATEFFFAPSHILRLRGQWGAELLRGRLQQGWAEFLNTIRRSLAFRAVAGRAGIARAYGEIARGEAAGDVVTILTTPGLA